MVILLFLCVAPLRDCIGVSVFMVAVIHDSEPMSTTHVNVIIHIAIHFTCHATLQRSYCAQKHG